MSPATFNVMMVICVPAVVIISYTHNLYTGLTHPKPNPLLYTTAMDCPVD